MRRPFRAEPETARQEVRLETGSSTIFKAACTIRSRTAEIQAAGTRPSGPAWGSAPRAQAKAGPALSQFGGQLIHEPERSVLVLDLGQRGLVNAGCAVVTRTATHPRHRTSLRKTLSHSAWNRLRDRPWPSGTACAAGHAPHPAENFGCRRTSRRIGTHRAPPSTQHASTKQGSFPHRRLCCPAGSAVLRPPPTPTRPAPTSRLVTGYRSRRPPGLRSQWAGEGLSSSRRHYLHVPRPLRRGIRHGCTFRIFTASMAFALLLRARHPLVPAIRRGRLTTRQASLHVTDHTVARPRTGALDAGLRPRPFPDDTASLLPGLLTATRTGLTPASDDELTSQSSTLIRSTTNPYWTHRSTTLTLYGSRAVANGLRTDHPIPGLPFVDDAHIPVDDPAAIEAIGRHPGGKTWGREDPAPHPRPEPDGSPTRPTLLAMTWRG